MDKNARDIMTHRKNIVAIDEEESLEDALHFMLETNYSRFPIYRGSIDEIIGFMHLREAMTCYLKTITEMFRQRITFLHKTCRFYTGV